MNKTRIQQELLALQDLEYQAFQSKLIPNLDPERVIGVRTPQLRKYAKELFRRPEAAEFMESLPHDYYEENNLHAFLLEQYKDYDALTQALNRFLPYVDNWATCDSMAPRILQKEPERTLEAVRGWLASGQTYIIRYGMGTLMRLFLDERFRPEYLEWVAGVRSDEYYVKMMAAWYFATALAKQYEAALPYITERRLEPWTHNKAIQKAMESYRITPEQKEYLKTFKVKGQ